MRVLADENLYDPIVNYLKSLGHDVLNIKETDYSGVSDDKIKP